MFANGPGDLGSIPGRVIPKTQKMVLDASLLNTQHYKVRIKGKVEQSREGVAPSPTHCCSSYRKGSLRVTLDYGQTLYKIYLKKTLSEKSSLYWSDQKKKKIRLIIYINKFKTSNLIISNTSWWDKRPYMFQCPLGESVSSEENTNVGLNTTHET